MLKWLLFEDGNIDESLIKVVVNLLVSDGLV